MSRVSPVIPVVYIFIRLSDKRIVFVTIASFLVIVITCVARSAPHYEPSKAVWATFLNDSGWNSGGVAFLTGLVTPNYMYAGIDGALHLAEECKNASTVVPRALMSTLSIGFVTSLSFMIAMLYCTSDLDAVVQSKTGYVHSVICKRRSNSNNKSAFLSMKCGIKQLAQTQLPQCLLSSLF
jgi:amino acid transporter